MQPGRSDGEATERHPAPRERPAVLAGIFLLALGIRLLQLLAVWTGPFSPAFYRPVDARLYHVWAIDWLYGSWPPHLPFERPPLYPWLLGLVYQGTGPSPLAALLLQAGMGAASCLLVFGIARHLLPDLRVARLAALACALSGPLVYFDAQLLSAGLDVFLGLLLLLLLLRAGERGGLAGWLAAGGVAGLSALNRGAVLLFAPCVLFWALRLAHPSGAAAGDAGSRRAPWLRAAAFASAMGVVMAPVSWHNARYDEPSGDSSPAAALRRIATGRFLPVASNAGINFYLGNHPELRELNRFEHPDHMAVYDRIRQEPDERGMTSLSAASNYLVRETLRHAAERPGDWLALMGIKLAELLNGTEIPRNTSLYADRADSPVLAVLLWRLGIAFPSGLVIPLGLAGIGLLRREWRRHFLPWSALATQAVFILGFFVTARYRLPMLPLLAIYAAHTALVLWDGWRAGARARVERLTGVVALLVAACNLPVVAVSDTHHWEDHYNVAVAHLEAGDRVRAERELRRAIELNPEADRGLVALCDLLLDEGRPEEALPFCRRSVAIAPESAAAHYSLGACLEALGRVEEGIPHYRQAAVLAPEAIEPRGALQRLRATGSP